MKFRWTLAGATRLSMAAILATSGIGLLTGCGESPSDGEEPPIESAIDPMAGDPAAIEGEGDDGTGAGDPAAAGDPATP